MSSAIDLSLSEQSQLKEKLYLIRKRSSQLYRILYKLKRYLAILIALSIDLADWIIANYWRFVPRMDIKMIFYQNSLYSAYFFI